MICLLDKVNLAFFLLLLSSVVPWLLLLIFTSNNMCILDTVMFGAEDNSGKENFKFRVFHTSNVEICVWFIRLKTFSCPALPFNDPFCR